MRQKDERSGTLRCAGSDLGMVVLLWLFVSIRIRLMNHSKDLTSASVSLDDLSLVTCLVICIIYNSEQIPRPHLPNPLLLPPSFALSTRFHLPRLFDHACFYSHKSNQVLSS